jgi:hypothetical protein
MPLATATLLSLPHKQPEARMLDLCRCLLLVGILARLRGFLDLNLTWHPVDHLEGKSDRAQKGYPESLGPRFHQLAAHLRQPASSSRCGYLSPERLEPLMQSTPRIYGKDLERLPWQRKCFRGVLTRAHRRLANAFHLCIASIWIRPKYWIRILGWKTRAR